MNPTPYSTIVNSKSGCIWFYQHNIAGTAPHCTMLYVYKSLSIGLLFADSKIIIILCMLYTCGWLPFHQLIVNSITFGVVVGQLHVSRCIYNTYS